jgi:hypothetical protein
MRFPDGEFAGISFLQEFGFGANRATQDAVDQRSISPTGELDRFVNRGVFGGLEQKQLVKAQTQQIARIVIEMTGPKFADPEIEQNQVAQNAVEKFRGKSAIRPIESAGSQALAENGISEPVAVAPFFKGRESDAA